MTYEQEFLKDFEEWVVTQVKVNETALAASKVSMICQMACSENVTINRE